MEQIKMDEIVSSPLAKFRLGSCEVCNSSYAKYTCPECEVKTCSLPCVKIHKKELECTGIRNKVKFKPLKKFTNMDFQSDYILLEEATRTTDKAKKMGKRLSNSTFYNMPRMKIKGAAHKRNIQLYFLPKSFTRHRTNTTYYDWKKDRLYWKVEWIFPESNSLTIVDNRVPEYEPLSVTLNKYLDPKKCDESYLKTLSQYHSVDLTQIRIVLKGEQESPNKYYLMDPEEPLMENISNKKIIEHPIFYVVFADSLSNYSIDPSECIKKRKFSTNYKGINLLFGSEN